MINLIIMLILIWLALPVILGIVCLVQKSRIKTLERDNEQLRKKLYKPQSGNEQTAPVQNPVSAQKESPTDTSASAYRPYNYYDLYSPAASAYPQDKQDNSAPDAPLFRDRDRVYNTNTDSPKPAADRSERPAAPVYPQNKQDTPVYNDIARTTASSGEYVYAARSQMPAHKEKKGPAAINVMLIVGTLFITISGFVFATAAWGTMNSFFRAVVLLSFSAVFFLLCYAAEKKLKLDSTGKVFYALGSAFLPAAAAAAGMLRVFGDYFSFFGGGRLLVVSLMAALLCACLFVGAKKYKSKNCARGGYGAFTFAFAAVMIHIGVSPAVSALLLSLYTLGASLIEPRIAKNAGNSIILKEYSFFAAANTWILAVVSLFLSQGGTLFVIPAAVFSAAFLLGAARSSSASAGTFACAAYLLAGAYLGVRPDSFETVILVAALVMIVYTCLSMLGVIPEKMRELTIRIRTVVSGIIIFVGVSGSAVKVFGRFEPTVLIAAATVFIQLVIVAAREKDIYGKWAAAGAFIWLAFESAKGIGLLYDIERTAFAALVMLFILIVKYTPAKKILYHRGTEITAFAVIFADLLISSTGYRDGLAVWAVCLITAALTDKSFAKFALTPVMVSLCLFLNLTGLSFEPCLLVYSLAIFIYFGAVKITPLKKLYYYKPLDIICFAVLFVACLCFGKGTGELCTAVWTLLLITAFLSWDNFGKYLAPVAILCAAKPSSAFLQPNITLLLICSLLLVYFGAVKLTGLKKRFYGYALDFCVYGVLTVCVFAFDYSEPYPIIGVVIWALSLGAAFLSYDRFGKYFAPVSIVLLRYPLVMAAAFPYGAVIYSGAVLAYLILSKLTGLHRAFYGKALDIITFVLIGISMLTVSDSQLSGYCGVMIWLMLLVSAFLSWDNFGRYLAPIAMLSLIIPLDRFSEFYLQAPVYAAALLVYFSAARLTGLKKYFYGKALDIVMFVPMLICVFEPYLGGLDPWGFAVWAMCMAASFISGKNFGKFLVPVTLFTLCYPLSNNLIFMYWEIIFGVLLLLWFITAKYSPLNKTYYGRWLDVVTFAEIFITMISTCTERSFYPQYYFFCCISLWVLLMVQTFLSGRDFSFGRAASAAAAGSLYFPLSMITEDITALWTEVVLFYCALSAAMLIKPFRRFADSFSTGIPIAVLIYFGITDMLTLDSVIIIPIAVTCYCLLRMYTVRGSRNYAPHIYFTLCMGCLLAFEVGRVLTDNENAFIFPAAFLLILLAGYLIPVKDMGKGHWAVGRFLGIFSAVYGIIIGTASVFYGNLLLLSGAWVMAAVSQTMCTVQKYTRLIYPQLVMLHICTAYASVPTSMVQLFLCGGAAVCAAAGRLIFRKNAFEQHNKDHLTLTAFTVPVMLLVMGDKMSVWPGCVTAALLVLDLVRPENRRSTNSTLFTIASLSVIPVFLTEPFFTVPALLQTEYILLPVAIGCTLIKLIHRERHYKEADVLSFAAAIISFVWLFFDAAATNEPVDAVILGGVILTTLIAAYVTRRKGWFILGTVSAVAAALLLSVKLWNSRLWWVYLLIAGLVLIIIGMTNEINKQKRRNGEQPKILFSDHWLDR